MRGRKRERQLEEEMIEYQAETPPEPSDADIQAEQICAISWDGSSTTVAAKSREHKCGRKHIRECTSAGACLYTQFDIDLADAFMEAPEFAFSWVEFSLG